MPKTKDLARVVEKWKRVTPARAEDYLQGVENPREDWASKTASSEPIYKTAVIDAANKGRFGAGVKKSGTANWQEKTLVKGRDRWGPGVAIADVAYGEGMAPVLSTITRTDIGVRYPAGDPRNIDRVAKLAAALHKQKVGS